MPSRMMVLRQMQLSHGEQHLATWIKTGHHQRTLAAQYWAETAAVEAPSVIAAVLIYQPAMPESTTKTE